MNTKELFETNNDFHNYILKYIRTSGKTIEQALREKTVKDVAQYYISEENKEIDDGK